MASYCQENVRSPYEDHSKNQTFEEKNYQSLQHGHFQHQGGLPGGIAGSQDTGARRTKGRTYYHTPTYHVREAKVGIWTSSMGKTAQPLLI